MCIALSAHSCKDSHGFGKRASRTAFRFFSPSRGTGAINGTTLASRSAPVGSAIGGCCQLHFGERRPLAAQRWPVLEAQGGVHRDRGKTREMLWSSHENT